MEKFDLKKMARECMEGNIESSRRRIKEYREDYEAILPIARIVEKVCNDLPREYFDWVDCSISSISIRTKGHGESTLVVHRLIQQEGIVLINDKFHKEICGEVDGEPTWQYVSRTKEGGFHISIGPSSPNYDCTPVKKERTWTSKDWVCELKEVQV